MILSQGGKRFGEEGGGITCQVKQSLIRYYFLIGVVVFIQLGKRIFDGLTVMISACHSAMRGRSGFDSPSESSLLSS
jgi:hypothetical protein